MFSPSSFFPVALVAFAGLFCDKPVSNSNTTTPEVPPITIKTETIINKREIIWGMDFLPNGDLIFTEKKGTLTRATKDSWALTEISGLPSDIDPKGQGGLLDIKLHPKYAENGWIYANYVSTGGWLNLIRFKLEGNAINSIQNIFKSTTPGTWGGHFGGRIVFDNAGFLFLCIGEGGSSTLGGPNSTNMNAQDTKSSWGKVHRMTDEGKVPEDNPVLPGNDKPSTIYSYGHRNPQGLTYDPVNNRIWETEHGPKGGDELNLIIAGKNYGWPLYSYGINYNGTTISDNPKHDGIEDAKANWVPSKAPSGLAYISSDKYGSWKGNLLSGALAHRYVARITLDGTKVAAQEKILDKEGRVRNIIQGPDGFIYVSLEGPGRVVRLVPE